MTFNKSKLKKRLLELSKKKVEVKWNFNWVGEPFKSKVEITSNKV